MAPAASKARAQEQEEEGKDEVNTPKSLMIGLR